jgi:hypothetical protein
MTTRLEISIANRDATEWSVKEEGTGVTDSMDAIDATNQLMMMRGPAEMRMFNGDVFDRARSGPNNPEEGGNVGNVGNMGKDGITMIRSPVRVATNIPGVLVLVGGKSYGKHPTNPTKHMYKCVPDDRRLPAFIVAYDSGKKGFSKMPHNLYITFRYVAWDTKHPRGAIVQNMGAVNVLENYYEYILYCKGLNTSTARLTRAARYAVNRVTGGPGDMDANMTAAIMTHITESIGTTIESRVDERVITIDPRGATDFDDAFSVKVYAGYQVLSVYVANVALWLEGLELWESMSDRVATVYLPDRKRTMLPSILSDSLCSLRRDHPRFALAMDMVVRDDAVVDVRYTNVIIRVAENYVYESRELRADPTYMNAFGISRRISRKNCVSTGGMTPNPPTSPIPPVTCSRDMVAYLMTRMNYECAKNLSGQSENGIYRATGFKNNRSNDDTRIPESLPPDVYAYLHNWKNYTGKYVHQIRTEHAIMGLDCYVHITSPIRRLVDLLNLMAFQKNNCLAPMSERAQAFYDRWTTHGGMEKINADMRAIRTVQGDCDLLRACVESPDVTDRAYTGIVFDREEREDGMYMYMVYIPDLKLTSRTTHRDRFENYVVGSFRVFVFDDEENMRRKVRVGIVA